MRLSVVQVRRTSFHPFTLSISHSPHPLNSTPLISLSFAPFDDHPSRATNFLRICAIPDMSATIKNNPIRSPCFYVSSGTDWRVENRTHRSTRPIQCTSNTKTEHLNIFLGRLNKKKKTRSNDARGLWKLAMQLEINVVSFYAATARVTDLRSFYRINGAVPCRECVKRA